MGIAKHSDLQLAEEEGRGAREEHRRVCKDSAAAEASTAHWQVRGRKMDLFDHHRRMAAASDCSA